MSRERAKIDNKVLCEEYLNGYSTKELGEKYGVHPSTIIKRLKKHGGEEVLSKLNRKVSISNESLLEDYLVRKMTLREIAKKYKCHHETIRKKLLDTNDERVLNQFKERFNDRNPSEVIDIDDEKIGIVSNNTKRVFIVPKYLKEYVSQYAWNEVKGGYLRGRTGNINSNIHQVVLGCAINGNVIDHIDQDTTNNMPENLRVVTYSINAQHRIKSSLNKYEFKGLWYIKNEDSWRSCIKIGGKEFYLGQSKNKCKIAFKYLNTKLELFGESYMSNDELEDYVYLSKKLFNVDVFFASLMEDE